MYLLDVLLQTALKCNGIIALDTLVIPYILMDTLSVSIQAIPAASHEGTLITYKFLLIHFILALLQILYHVIASHEMFFIISLIILFQSLKIQITVQLGI